MCYQASGTQFKFDKGVNNQPIRFDVTLSKILYILSYGEVIHQCGAKALAEDKQVQAEHIGVAKPVT